MILLVVQKKNKAQSELTLKKKKDYISPEKADEEREKGNEQHRLGNFAKAVEFYEEAVKRNPKDARNFGNRSSALMKLGSFPEALKDVDKCLELDPTYMKAWARYSFFLLFSFNCLGGK